MARGSREQREAWPPRGHPTTTWEQARRKAAHLSGSFRPRGLYSPWNSPGQNTGVGRCSSPGDLPNPGFKPRSPALQADSLQLGQLCMLATLPTLKACGAVTDTCAVSNIPGPVIRKQFEACWTFNKSILRGQLKVRCLSPQPFSESTRKYAPRC